MSIRKLQVAELLRRNLSHIFQADGRYIYGTEPMVTVTSVQVTPDLAQAKVYLSIFNTDNKQAVLLEIEAAIVEIKRIFTTGSENTFDAYRTLFSLSTIPWTKWLRWMK